MIAGALTPFLLFQFYNEHTDRQIRQHIMEDEALRVARLVDTQLLQIVEGAEQVLNVIGSAPDILEGRQDRCARLLTNVLSRSQRYAGIGVLNHEGNPVCGLEPFDPTDNLSDRAYFQRARTSDRLAVGDFVRGRRIGGETIHLAKPYTPAGQGAAGIVVISLRLDWLATRLAELPLPPGTSATIADRNGTILARFPNGESYVGKKVVANAPLSLQGTASGVGKIISVDGTPRMAAWIPPAAEKNGFFVGIGLDRNAMFAEITADNQIGVVLIVVIGILTLLLAWFFGGRLIGRPVLRLLQATERWRAGELGTRTRLAHDNSEFGRLASALDDMAQTTMLREAVLRENEERLRLAMVTARLGVRELDLITGQATSSPEAEEIFGRDAERDVHIERWFEQVHPDDRARLRENWARARETPGVDIEHEYRFRRPDGSWRWIAAHGRLMFEDGRPVRTIGVIQDITERRRMEDELRALTRSLETRVQDEITAREAAQMRAVHGERMQALGQLAGGIAHDFNNVLQAVSGALRLIGRRPGDADSVLRLSLLAAEATERGASITRRLLAFGRRADLRTEAIDAEALLHDLCEILTHTLGAAIEVRIETEHGLPRFTADKSQLETSLINLATNARDAMPDGGVLTLSARHDTVNADDRGHEAGLAPGDYVRLSIEDTGLGMDQATLARASEPFFTTKKDGAGTGLGLAMAKGFVEQSGGQLQVQSHPGQGTSVTIWLPRAEVEIASPQRASPTDVSGFGTAGAARILLVDDDDAVRSVLKMELEAAGYHVLAAPGGAAAVALVDAGHPFTALVTDLSMAGMDGLGVIRAVQKIRPGLPAILLTGYAGDGAALAVGGVVSGAFSLLRKPVSTEQLIDRLEALIAEQSETIL
jgi:PAS domain S-box-containing protein